MRPSLLLARSTLAIAGVMLAIMFAELALSLAVAGQPLSTVTHLGFADATHLNTLIGSNLNQILAVTFTAVAIAVALTGSTYSVKFLEFFIRDPVNAVALGLVVFAGLHNTWLGYTLRDGFVPEIEVYVGLALTVMCFTFIFPYLYYVFRFLHPNSVIAKLEQEIDAALKGATKQPAKMASYQRQLSEAMEHVANICVRSVERDDRNTAIEGIQSLERIASRYWQAKPLLPEPWFVANPTLFLGYSTEAIVEFTTDRSWVEMKLFSQYNHVLAVAVGRVPDLVSAIASSTCGLGQAEPSVRDNALRRLTIEYFNTYLRLALNRRDARAVFTIFEQYRKFAEAICVDFPDNVSEVAYYFEYYSRLANDLQMPFIVEVIAHDLGALVRYAWTVGAPNRKTLLDRFVRFEMATPVALAGVRKAQAILASFFLLAGDSEPVAVIRDALARVDSEALTCIRDELALVTRPDYWEVNERRMNIHYVPETQRQKLLEFIDGLNTAAEVATS